MKHIFQGLFIVYVVAMVTWWVFGAKTENRRPNVSEAQMQVQQSQPESSDSAGISTGGGRAPASDNVHAGAAEEAINTLTDSGVQRDNLNGNSSFTNKYGQFDVEVITDKHDEDAPSVMKFYVKCRDNRPDQCENRSKPECKYGARGTGPNPNRELLKESSVSGLTTCHYDNLQFIENATEGDSVRVNYHIDKAGNVRNRADLKKREFCDQMMSVDFNFPELCEKWNPGYFID
jgi:hypothetical protein